MFDFLLLANRARLRLANGSPPPTPDPADDLTQRQLAVLACLRACGPAIDVDWIAAYRALGYPNQSDSGLRTRRSELVAQKKVAPSGFKMIGMSRHTVWRAI